MEKFQTKYKPAIIEDIVLHNKSYLAKLRLTAAGKMRRNLLFYGSFGSGKTTLAQLLPKLFHGAHNDNCAFDAEIDCDQTGHIDVGSFSKTDCNPSFLPSGHTWTILNEFEKLKFFEQQRVLSAMDKPNRGFIITANDIGQVYQGIQDRCTVMHLDTPKPEQFLSRAQQIMKCEGIEATDEEILKLLKGCNPSIRSYLDALEDIAIELRYAA